MRLTLSGFFAMFMVAICGFAVFTALKWPVHTALLPLVIGIPTFCLSLLQLARELRWSGRLRRVRSPSTSDLDIDDSLPIGLVVKRASILFGYLVILLISITIFGFFVVMPTFALLYLRFEGRQTWLLSFTLATTVLLVLTAFDTVLHPAWIESYISRPDEVLRHLISFP